MFICPFCPLENILLMLPTCSESALWREALLSKWQTSHDHWYWRWVCFCFWPVCYQRTRIFSDACSYLPKLTSQWKAKSSFQSFAVYSVSCLFFFDIQERTDILVVPENHQFLICAGESRQPRWFLVKAILSLVVAVIIFFQYCAFLRIAFLLLPFIHTH